MKNDRELIHEKRPGPPWYYYVISVIAFSVFTTILQNALGIETEGWLRVALTMFFIFFIPRQMWERKQEKK